MPAPRRASRPEPLRAQRHPHDHVPDPDDEVVLLLECAPHPGREHQHPGDLHQRRHPVQHVVVVVRRGEPGEVHPRPPDGEEDHGVVEQPRPDPLVGERADQLHPGLPDRDHEAEVEEELQGRRDPVLLVAPASDHRQQRRAERRRRWRGHGAHPSRAAPGRRGAAPGGTPGRGRAGEPATWTDGPTPAARPVPGGRPRPPRPRVADHTGAHPGVRTPAGRTLDP